MQNTNEIQYMRYAWVIVGFFSVLRLFYAQWFLLSPDETNYWQWARHLAWGYHDQAPMIAWTIYLATAVLGHTEVAVRLPSIIAITIASVYLVRMAQKWFNEAIAFQTAVLSQSVFLLNVGALLATADGLQAVAWSGAVYHTSMAFERDRWSQWLLGGMWFGIGMLSKYTMVLFLPCVFIYALLSDRHRRKLLYIKPYIGCLVGSIMFLPVIFWNAAHNWNSVRHVAYIGGANQKFVIHWNFLGDYIGSQIGLLTPFVFFLVIASWYLVIRRPVLRNNWIYRYLFFTSFPVFFGFALLSLHSRVYGNWPGFGYVPAILLATVVWAFLQPDANFSEVKGSTRPFWKVTVGSAYLLTALVLIHVVIPILPIPPKMDRTYEELKGWDKLGQRVGQIHEKMPDPQNTFFFGIRYQVASELAFYVPGQPDTVSINRWDRPNVYDYWWEDKELIGKDAIGVSASQGKRDKLLEVFNQVDPPEKITLRSKSIWFGADNASAPLKNWYAYRCYGFKGGLRWLPPDQFDIRAQSK